MNNMMNKAQNASFKYWQTRTIISTIIIYATFYLVRKNLSMAMPDLQADLGISKAELGLFLTLHGVVYGVSKFLSGFAADRLNARHMLVVALLLCSICNFIFGLSSSILALGIIWVFNGFWGYLSVFATGWGVGYVTDMFGWSYSLGIIFVSGVIGSLIFAMAWSSKSDGYEVG